MRRKPFGSMDPGATSSPKALGESNSLCRRVQLKESMDRSGMAFIGAALDTGVGAGPGLPASAGNPISAGGALNPLDEGGGVLIQLT